MKIQLYIIIGLILVTGYVIWNNDRLRDRLAATKMAPDTVIVTEYYELPPVVMRVPVETIVWRADSQQIKQIKQIDTIRIYVEPPVDTLDEVQYAMMDTMIADVGCLSVIYWYNPPTFDILIFDRFREREILTISKPVKRRNWTVFGGALVGEKTVQVQGGLYFRTFGGIIGYSDSGLLLGFGIKKEF